MKAAFPLFFGCESSSLLHCTTVEIGKISSRGELDKRQQFRKPCSISQNTLASAVLFFVSNCLNEKLQHHGNCLSNIMCMDLLMGSVQMPLQSSIIEKKRDRLRNEGLFVSSSVFIYLHFQKYIIVNICRTIGVTGEIRTFSICACLLITLVVVT